VTAARQGARWHQQNNERNLAKLRVLGAFAFAGLVALLILLVAACFERSVYSTIESTLRTLHGGIGMNALRKLLGDIEVDMPVWPLTYFGKDELKI